MCFFKKLILLYVVLSGHLGIGHLILLNSSTSSFTFWFSKYKPPLGKLASQKYILDYNVWDGIGQVELFIFNIFFVCEDNFVA